MSSSIQGPRQEAQGSRQQVIEEYIAELRTQSNFGSELLPVFNKLVAGSVGRPELGDAFPSPELLIRDIDSLAFAPYYQNATETFHEHLHASIPGYAEDQCRLGSAISRYAMNHVNRTGRPLDLWSLGACESPLARAVARHAGGDVLRSHCSSQASEVFAELARFPEKDPNVSFEVAPFYAAQHPHLPPGEGYDIIFEETHFQMLHPNRIGPLEILSQKLRDDGVMLLYQKFLSDTKEEYERREIEKDKVYKSRYFSDEQIQSKHDMILTHMENGQVYLEDFLSATKRVAKYIVMIWRSGNFAGIAASNDSRNLAEFIGLLPQQFVENPMYSRGLPINLGDPLDVTLRFRPDRTFTR